MRFAVFDVASNAESALLALLRSVVNSNTPQGYVEMHPQGYVEKHPRDTWKYTPGIHGNTSLHLRFRDCGLKPDHYFIDFALSVKIGESFLPI